MPTSGGSVFEHVRRRDHRFGETTAFASEELRPQNFGNACGLLRPVLQDLDAIAEL
jgi:hypothetical protein